MPDTAETGTTDGGHLPAAVIDMGARGASTSPIPGGFRAGATSFLGAVDTRAPPPGKLVVFSCNEQPVPCQSSGGPRCARAYDCP
jgi:hypothetical protein